MIQQQNKQLTEYSGNLENEIAKRSSDLVATNKELVEQNNQLQQFSFMSAHNLRAPVARILGLANILNLPDQKMEDQKLLIEKMVFTTHELDTVIHDLGKILEMKKGTHERYTEIDLEDVIDRVLNLLEDEVRKTKAVVTIDVSLCTHIISLAPYIESIVFNLVSNAIKYRSGNRVPNIKVMCWSKDNSITLAVSDNGMGIDLSRFGEKLFGLYQRFHDHVEGRGLGLHFVKEQVSALGGKMDVTSILDKGTTFTIVLPKR
jgi:light-regulated signal transduction histidine kinase (bacteriophytochrome)